MTTPPGPPVPPEGYPPAGYPAVPPEGYPYVPVTGYQLPTAYGQYAQPFHFGPYDPLVPDYGSGFEGWWARVLAAFRANVGQLSLIFLLTALPTIVLTVGVAATGAANSFVTYDAQGVPQADLGPFLGFFCGLFVFLIFVSFLNALAWASAIHAVTARAAGQPATVGGALRAGLRRAAPMWGWFWLAYLIVLAGICACVLPAFYLTFAVSLFSFPVMFERGRNPIGRSFRMINANLGPALGRVAMMAGIYIGVAGAVSLASTLLVTVVTGQRGSIFVAQPGQVPALSGAGLATQIVTSVIQAAVGLPLMAFLLVGLMITYTQLRRNEEPITTQQLWAEAQ